MGKQIMIPAPQYVVLYNGTERREEEFVQKLSDAFESGRKGCMELEVRTININRGHNEQLLSKCKTLADYSYFVAEVRRNLEIMTLQGAVESAVDTCISQDVLSDFLLEQKAEVIAMSIYEYNEEYVRKVLLEEGMEKGMEKGIRALVETCNELGITRGETMLKLEQKFELTKDVAEAYLAQFWEKK